MKAIMNEPYRTGPRQAAVRLRTAHEGTGIYMYIYGSAQDYGNYVAKALELPQSYAKPLVCARENFIIPWPNCDRCDIETDFVVITQKCPCKL